MSQDPKFFALKADQALEAKPLAHCNWCGPRRVRPIHAPQTPCTTQALPCMMLFQVLMPGLANNSNLTISLSIQSFAGFRSLISAECKSAQLTFYCPRQGVDRRS